RLPPPCRRRSRPHYRSLATRSPSPAPCLRSCRYTMTPAAAAAPTPFPRVSMSRIVLSHWVTPHTSSPELRRSVRTSCASTCVYFRVQENSAKVFSHFYFRVRMLDALFIATGFLRAVTCSIEQFSTCSSVPYDLARIPFRAENRETTVLVLVRSCSFREKP